MSPSACRAYLADGLELLGFHGPSPAAELEHHREPLRRNERAAHVVVQCPHCHIARAGRVANVAGIEEHRGTDTFGGERALNAIEPVGTHAPLRHVVKWFRQRSR